MSHLSYLKLTKRSDEFDRGWIHGLKIIISAAVEQCRSSAPGREVSLVSSNKNWIDDVSPSPQCKTAARHGVVVPVRVGKGSFT